MKGVAPRAILDLTDIDLCRAAFELREGQGDDLGGGVWKKRLDKNRQRAIVITTSVAFTIFVYLFAKKDRANITAQELVGFKKLSRDYQRSDARLLSENGDLHEICREDEEGQG